MFKKLCVILLLCQAAFPAAADPAAAQSPTLRWSELDYQANKFLLSVQIHVGVSNVTSETATKQFVAPRRGVPVTATDTELNLLQIDTKFLTQNTQIQLWLNQTGSALQRTSLYTGRKYWYRAYRYLEDGVYSIKRRPRDDEKEHAYTQWSDTNEDDYRYDPPTEGMTETEALFLMVAKGNWQKPGDTLTFPVFSTDGLGLARVRYEGTKSLKANYEEVSAGGSRKVSGNLDVMHITFNIDPMKPGVSKDAFELLGMQGDIDLYVDRERRILLQLSGKTDSVGALDVKLRRAVVK